MFGSKRALIRLQIAVPKTRARLGVERKSSERLFRGLAETKKTPKNALAWLEWHKHRWKVARRRQARLEVEARCRKVLYAPSRVDA